MKPIDVFGLGNALMDFLVEVDDATLSELGLKKGIFHNLTEQQSKELLKKLKQHHLKIVPGGSTANTIATLKLLGLQAVFCGCVGDDEHGDAYISDFMNARIKKSGKITGHAITFITPDAQRTFAVNLGAALDLHKSHIIEDDIKQSKIVHIESYLFDEPQLKEAALHAMDYAKKHKALVSLDLSDAELVKRHAKEIKGILKTYVDILFMNDAEAKAFTGMDGITSLQLLSSYARIVVLKLGAKGSMIKHGETIHNIDAVPANAIDTTGAGDAYAAGFLYGLVKGYELRKCGMIGSLLGAEAVSALGARLSPDILDKVRKITETTTPP